MTARADPDLRVVITLTRQQSEVWTGHRGRIDKALLAEAGYPPGQRPKIYVCRSIRVDAVFME